MTRQAVDAYDLFLQSKNHVGADSGFTPLFLPDFLFDFQKALAEWAVLKGRAAIFADCGLGKTIIELVWAENIFRYTEKPVLILTPLAVSAQTVREAEKFGIECGRFYDGGGIHRRITITNYEQLHKLTADDFAGVVCDESSILKNFSGARKSEITEFMKKVPYRLLATATAAPNDYIELGTSSEALGYMGFMDMLGAFFKNDQNNCAIRRMYGEAPKWRFKGHAELPFWRWVTSWARACRQPSDLGFDDRLFRLPPLIEKNTLVTECTAPKGMLFNIPASTLPEQRKEKRRTIEARCEKLAAAVSGDDPAFVFCHLNDEGDLLEKLIPGCVQVSGSDSDEKKEESFLNFVDQKVRVLITKPKIGAWGLNFQHCNHVAGFPSHSYEQYYQVVRRCWRFGQKRPVMVDIFLTEGEKKILANMQEKAKHTMIMFENLVAEMNNSICIQTNNNHTVEAKIPSWL